MKESSKLQLFRSDIIYAALRRGARTGLLGAFSLSVLAAGSAAAATFTVDSAADTADSSAADSLCNDGSNHCTLRAAIQQASALGGANTINVPAGTYLVGSVLAAENDSNNLTIIGTGAAGTTIIDGQNATTLFKLNGGTVNLTNLVIQNGMGTIDINSGNEGVCLGAGVLVTGTTDSTIALSTIRNNSVINASGGGVCLAGFGNVTIDRSTISGNLATNGGAGIRIQTGTLTIISSTISNNVLDNTLTVGACGGAIESQAVINVRNSTISGNTASVLNNNADSGAVCSIGEVGAPVSASFSNSTITDNFGNGGQLRVKYSTVNLESTIVSNPNTGTNCGATTAGTFTSSGHNLDTDHSCGLSAAGDISANPQLGPLQNNGGPTATHALGSGSAAIGTGSNSLGLTTDQRGVGYPRVVKGAPDIGAFESPYQRKASLIPQAMLLLLD